MRVPRMRLSHEHSYHECCTMCVCVCVSHAGIMNAAWGLTGGSPTTSTAPMWRGFSPMFTIVGAPLTSIPTYNGFIFEALDPATLQPWDLQVRCTVHTVLLDTVSCSLTLKAHSCRHKLRM